MLTQAARQLDRCDGPLGVSFRRLSRKEERNVSVVAGARKLVTLAYLMLKHNEPYRHAVPRPTRSKLACLRVRATGERRKPDGVARASRPAHWHPGGAPRRSRRWRRST